ncbi:hypothetical protein EMIHUDRAFT_452317, partial [Emiliania huxleyi CCMP1516]|uniref:BZIP domain-containing protein n=2 Tax=Emiliania huxleyi TaxID=2903 RepID=A0A0D3IKR3_EMIH1
MLPGLIESEAALNPSGLQKKALSDDILERISNDLPSDLPPPNHWQRPEQYRALDGHGIHAGFGGGHSSGPAASLPAAQQHFGDRRSSAGALPLPAGMAPAVMHRGLSALASSGHVLERAPGAAAPSPTPARGPTSPLPVPHISQGGRAGSLAPPSAQAQAAAQLRAQLQAQQGELRRERELAKAAASHQKALRAKEEEVGAARREAARREEERTRKLSEAHKELQQDLSKRDEQLAALRRSLATAEASASEAR